MIDVVLGVDGGNSKTDVALVDTGGMLRALVRGPTVSHQVVGIDTGAKRLADLVANAMVMAGLDRGQFLPSIGVYCLAGADFPSDVRLISRELARHRLARSDLVLNDTFAALRAGAQKGWGVVLICGQGINAAGVAPDGRTARFAGIGSLSGDWGGGGGLGVAALASAIRARDGRGPRTALERAVAAHFGRRTPEAVMREMYEQTLPSSRLRELAPVVFHEAELGDAVAQSIVDKLADELATMASALIRRLRLRRREVDVVMAGGVFRATYPAFYERLREGIVRHARSARLVRPLVPPVGGAALIALDRFGESTHLSQFAAARLTREFARRSAEGWP